jgi:ribosomal protein L11 methyltransferase
VLELTLRVAAADVEEVLDAVLPSLPGGVHIRQRGEEVEMAVPVIAGTPGEDVLRELAGPRLAGVTSAEASDDWRERRLSRYEPLIVDDRFLVRPDWAPAGDDPRLVEIVLEPRPAFGTGVHPTTQSCLAALGEVSEPGGSFADYGCGSGVLSIAAALLGFSPVVAVDIDEQSLAATRDNAARNGVEVEARRVDLTSEAPPAAETIVANVPPAVQLALAGAIESVPSLVIASGFSADDVAEVAAAWGAHGLEVAEEQRVMEWSMLKLR